MLQVTSCKPFSAAVGNGETCQARRALTWRRKRLPLRRCRRIRRKAGKPRRRRRKRLPWRR